MCLTLRNAVAVLDHQDGRSPAPCTPEPATTSVVSTRVIAGSPDRT